MTIFRPKLLHKINFQEIITLAKQAGFQTLKFYNQTSNFSLKADHSPVTDADIASHNIIIKGLKKMTPDIPILSEESPELDIKNRIDWKIFWLVDPLDGTKEFINRKSEYTINIALIQNNKPVWGVVYAPALDVCYWGGLGVSKKQNSDSPPYIIKISNKKKKQRYRVVGSKSHHSKDFSNFVSRLIEPEIVQMGSSLKLCLVADGTADIYPRYGLTSEWDTAAAHAIVNGSGGEVVEIDSYTQLKYNKLDSMLNPFFIVGAKNILEDIKKYL